jgi:iron complex outermembrane recepter protein
VSGIRSLRIVDRHGQFLSCRLPAILAWGALGPALIGALGLSSPVWGQSVLPPLQVEGKKAAAKPAKRKQTAAPKSDPAQEQAPPAEKAETSTGRVDGYVATVTGTGSKTDTPLLLTPQSVSVITADQIKDQGAQSIIEALRYTSGVSVELNSDTRYDETYIRGFRAVQYLDGMPVPLNQFFGTPRIEPYGLERIEVLKGPASFLYGQNSPGGLLNMISKRPTEEAQNELQLQYGSFNRFQTNFDFSGPATRDGTILYRLTGTVRDAETVVDYTRDDVFSISPALTWRPSADTSLTVLANYGWDKGTFPHQYLPAQGTLLPNPNGRLPLSRFAGEPGWDRFDREQWAVGYELEHRLSDAWKFRQNLRYASVDLYFQAHRVEGYADPELTTVNRSANAVSADAGTFTVDNQLQTQFRTGALQHKALVGVDYLRMTGDFTFKSAQSSPLNLYNPEYGAAVIPPLPTAQDNFTQQTQLGVYVQDQIKLGNWLLTVGGRQDWAETTTERSAEDPLGPRPVSQEDAAFTGRAGLTYLFPIGLAPFASYATSFQPTVSASGQPLKPATGRQYEAGIKYQPAGPDLLVTAAVFDILQENFLTSTPDFATSSQIGEVSVRGFDIEARARLTRNIDLLASYAYLDSEVTASINRFEIGRQVPLVPVHAARAWAKYTFTEGPLAGLWIGGGVRYVGTTFAETSSFNPQDPANPLNPLKIPGYALFDAGIAYDLRRLDKSLEGAELSLNVANLFDEHHVAGYCDRTYCSLGEGRTVLATLRYRW